MVQKVIKIGDSLGVTIPKSRVNELGLTAGDKVEVYFSKDKDLIKHLDLLQNFREFENRYSVALKNLAKR